MVSSSFLRGKLLRSVLHLFHQAFVQCVQTGTGVLTGLRLRDGVAWLSARNQEMHYCDNSPVDKSINPGHWSLVRIWSGFGPRGHHSQDPIYAHHYSEPHR